MIYRDKDSGVEWVVEPEGGSDPLASDSAFLDYAERHRLVSPRRIALGRLSVRWRERLARLVPRRLDVERKAGATLPEVSPGRADLEQGRTSLNAQASATHTVRSQIVPVPKWLQADGVKSLATIRNYNPDSSLGVDQAKAFALTPHRMYVLVVDGEGVTTDVDDVSTGRLQALFDRSFRSHEGGGIEAMVSVGLECLWSIGAVAGELDVAPNLRDVLEIVLVDPALVRWELSIGRYRAVWLGGQKPVPFNMNQFVYSGQATTIRDPHGQAITLPALDTSLAQHQFRNLLQKVVRAQGFGRLTASVSWDKAADRMPSNVQSRAELAAWMKDVLKLVGEQLRTENPDDAITIFDFVTLGFAGASHGSQSFRPGELSEVFDVPHTIGIKTPAMLLGYSHGTAFSSTSDVQFVSYARRVTAWRNTVVRALEELGDQTLRIWGVSGKCVIDFDPIDTEDQVAAANARLSRTNELKIAYEAGIIDAPYWAQVMGYPEPDAEATAAKLAEKAATPSRSRVARASSVERKTRYVRCPACDVRQIRTKDGQQKCTGCGAYLHAHWKGEQPAKSRGESGRASGVDEVLDDVARGALAGDDAVAAVELARARDDSPLWDVDVERDDGEKVTPRGTPLGAVQLMTGSFVAQDDADRVARRFDAWARTNAPAFVGLLRATPVTSRPRSTLARAGVVDVERAGPSARSKWQWDANIQRYRYPPKLTDKAQKRSQFGRILTPDASSRLKERRIAEYRAEMERATNRLLGGEVDVAKWQESLRLLLRDAHLEMREIAVGGRELMTAADFGAAGGRIGREMQFLADFGQQIAKGELSAARILQRAGLRAAANLRDTYTRGTDSSHRAAGFQFQENQLEPGSKHCDDCLAETAAGRVAIGSGIPIGGRTCGPNCHCEIVYFYDEERQLPPQDIRQDAATSLDPVEVDPEASSYVRAGTPYALTLLDLVRSDR